MKNKVYLDNDTLESIKEEGIYPTIIELTTEDCPECYDAARSAYWSQARGVTTCNPHRDNESLGYHLARLFGIDPETVEFSGLWADDELEFFTIPTTINPQEALAAVKNLIKEETLDEQENYWNPKVFTKAFMQTRSKCSWCAWTPIPA